MSAGDRQRQTPKIIRPAPEAKTKKTSFNFTPGLITKVKMQAAQNGESMIALIERAVRRELSK